MARRFTIDQIFFQTSWFLDSCLLNRLYGVAWWMPLRWDSICVEEPAFCSDRLSLHRLPAKRRCALRAVGIGPAAGSGRDKRGTAQNRVCGSDSLFCGVLRHALGLLGHRRLRSDL